MTVAMFHCHRGLNTSSMHSVSCPTTALTEAAIVVAHDDVILLDVDGEYIERRVGAIDTFAGDTCLEITPLNGTPKSVRLVGIKGN